MFEKAKVVWLSGVDMASAGKLSSDFSLHAYMHFWQTMLCVRLVPLRKSLPGRFRYVIGFGRGFPSSLLSFPRILGKCYNIIKVCDCNCYTKVLEQNFGM